MASSFEFDAQLRTQTGSGSARALRRNNQVPAVLYGAGGAVEYLALDHHKVAKNLENDAVYSHILNIKIDGRDCSAILKEIQRHPSKPIILHMDFQRVSKSEKVRVHVPLHFVGESVSVGVKKGGVVMHNLVDVEVSCLPGDLPEFIEVDLSGVDVGENVHLSDLVVPAAVDIVELGHGPEHDIPVATIQAGKMAAPEEEAGAE